jgi:hypothetical protein
MRSSGSILFARAAANLSCSWRNMRTMLFRYNRAAKTGRLTHGCEQWITASSFAPIVTSHIMGAAGSPPLSPTRLHSYIATMSIDPLTKLG